MQLIIFMFWPAKKHLSPAAVHILHVREGECFLPLIPYNRRAAVAYAHQWAYRRNPDFYDFSDLGGDCTNFASQCVLAGANGVMNTTPEYGWYYIDLNNRTPSWTGVEYFYEFMVNNEGIGPFMRTVPLFQIRPGDVIQLNFTGERYAHTPVVVATGLIPSPDNILVAAHSNDVDYRPLNTYTYESIRALQVVGVRT